MVGLVLVVDAIVVALSEALGKIDKRGAQDKVLLKGKLRVDLRR